MERMILSVVSLFALSLVVLAQDFSNYPTGAQSCLMTSAYASGCVATASNAINLNYCLCNNGGYFVQRVAQCLYVNDQSDMTTVYNTMKYNCASSNTPIGFTLDQFIVAGGSKPSSSISTFASSTKTTILPPSTYTPTTASPITNTPVAGTPIADAPVAGTPIADTPTGGTPIPVSIEQDHTSGLKTGDKIAIGIGVPVGLFTIIGAIVACKKCLN